MTNPMNTVNYYTSDYGTFEIPDHIFGSITLETREFESYAPNVDTTQKGWDVVPVDRCPSNAPFFDWLEAAEADL